MDGPVPYSIIVSKVSAIPVQEVRIVISGVAVVLTDFELALSPVRVLLLDLFAATSD